MSAHFNYVQCKEKGSPRFGEATPAPPDRGEPEAGEAGVVNPLVIAVVIAVLALGAYFAYSNQNKTIPASKPSPNPTKSAPVTQANSSSAKGVIMVQSPTAGQAIRSPLTVTGFVYGNQGTLTIKLKQSKSGMYVTEDKVIKIAGASDKITFAEAIQFGSPAEPQTGALEVLYKDESGKGLDDKVSIDVQFPSDLGSGLK